ncbi:MAG TPA: prolipoprotein diacylglyceryl transferase [Blastocatellia bacterium]|nr:prolipoprotein diacylglyceryl transferase [Blastocatellia bacterium]
MFPELFRVPYFNYPIPTYGVLLALSFVTSLFVAMRLAEKDGLDRNRIYDLALYTIGASLVGSKLLMVITDPWLLKPEHFFSREFWGSGGVYFGGFLGAFTASILLARLYKMPWWTVADAFAPAIAIGQAIGRLGFFSAGCGWGTECSLPWGVEFTAAAHTYTGVPIGVHLHPVQLYESALTLGIFLFLLWLRKHRAFTGQVVLAYLVLYSAVRFTLEFWRDDPRGDVWGWTTATGLSTSQLIATVCGLGGLALMMFMWRRARRRPADALADDDSSVDHEPRPAPVS